MVSEPRVSQGKGAHQLGLCQVGQVRLLLGTSARAGSRKHSFLYMSGDCPVLARLFLGLAKLSLQAGHCSPQPGEDGVSEDRGSALGSSPQMLHHVTMRRLF